MLPENMDAGIPTLAETIEKIQALSEKANAENAAAVEPPASGLEQSAAVPDVRADTPATEQAGSQAESTPPNAPPEAEVISPRLRRLIEREASLIEREKKLKELEGTKAQNIPSEVDLNTLKRLYKQNPREALKVLDENFQPGRLARKLWIDDLGDLAPKEARAEVEAEYAKSSVDVLRAEMDEREQRMLGAIREQQSQMAYQQYMGALENYAAQLPDSLPLTKKFVAKNPTKVVQALVGMAQKHARATGGQVLTPEQAATKLEASLKELQLVDPAPTTSATPTATPNTSSTPNTLRNKHTSIQANRGTEDDLDDEALFKRSMAAIEAAKKRRSDLGY